MSPVATGKRDAARNTAAGVGRLLKRAEFLAARKGRRLNGPFFTIEALDRGDGAAPRLGLTVTKKVGNAVVRNRIRRRLREAVRTTCGADMRRGFDYVIVARRDVLDLPFDRLSAELSRRLGGRHKGAAGADAARGAVSQPGPRPDDGGMPPLGGSGNG